MDDELPIGYPLSSLAQRYIGAERSMHVTRRRSLTCSREKLGELLTAHGIVLTEAAFDFEQNLGGWGYDRPDSEYCFGIYCSLRAGEGASTVAKAFRQMNWLFERAREQPNVDGEVSPIWGTGHPRLFFRDRPLIPAGMKGTELLYFVGPHGEIYLYQRETDVLLLVAGAGRAMIERDAFAALTPGWDDWYRVHVCGDAAVLASASLGVAECKRCSDALFRVWANDDVQIVSVPDIAPCIGGTVVATRRPDDLLKVIRECSALTPSGTLCCWERANNLRDERGLSLLSRGDVSVRVLNGAAPGHYDRVVDGETGEVTYQPSMYEGRGGSEDDASVRDTKNST